MLTSCLATETSQSCNIQLLVLSLPSIPNATASVDHKAWSFFFWLFLFLFCIGDPALSYCFGFPYIISFIDFNIWVSILPSMKASLSPATDLLVCSYSLYQRIPPFCTLSGAITRQLSSFHLDPPKAHHRVFD